MGTFSSAPGVFSAIRKIRCVRRWREMFLWVDDALFPRTSHSIQGLLPRMRALVVILHIPKEEDADVAEVDSGLKRKRATNDDGAGPSKRVRPVSLGLSTSTEEETLDAPPTLTAKEVTETPPPNVEATSDSSAPVTHVVQSPPQTNPLTTDDISRRGRETGPKAFEGMPVDQLMEELDMVTAQQAALVAQLRARLSSERGQSVQKDEEILLLKTQLADAQAEAESSRSYAQKLAEEKMALLVKVEQERADSADYKASCHWAVKYLEGCALARVSAEAWKVLNKEEADSAGAQGAEAKTDNFLKRTWRQLQVPIFACPRDILNPFALEREIPLKESLEAHAIRLAKKKGVKGKAILCGVGAAHVPRSDGVPVSVATVSPKDSELLGKLEEAGDAAYQVGSSERSRCHSI
ncbi:hypothetical protein Tco_1377912 [Tanacetum coccineum]